MMQRDCRFLIGFVVSVLSVAGCQSPTDPDEALEVDDFLEVNATPNPTTASESTDGRTYRVVRGNNQPDDILVFDWKTAFTITATLNSQADDDEALEFPVNLTAVTVVVKQASGGIVTPPTGGDVERYDYVTNANTNVYPAVNSTVTIGLEVWYDLPSLRREALVTVTLSFTDDDGQAFSKVVDVRVAP
jgi:hypothetical protein